MFNALIALTLGLAVLNWWASHTERKVWEYLSKPATMAALIAAALAIADPAAHEAAGGRIRLVMVVGLAFSLVGDVFLMLPKRMFLQGLASFLLAHIAYTIGLAMLGVDVLGLVLGAIFVGIAVALIGPRIVGGARAEDSRMGSAVSAYLTIISLMVIVAFGTGNPLAIVGAVLFYASDGLIGWDKFVGELPYRNLLVMVTYHLGQIGLVLSLTI